jgi:hypothetical protein
MEKGVANSRDEGSIVLFSRLRKGLGLQDGVREKLARDCVRRVLSRFFLASTRSTMESAG